MHFYRFIASLYDKFPEYCREKFETHMKTVLQNKSQLWIDVIDGILWANITYKLVTDMLIGWMVGWSVDRGFRGLLIAWFSYSLAHLMIGRLTKWFDGSLNDWLIDCLNNWMIYLFLGSLTDWLIHWLIDSLIDWFIDWLIDWLIDWFIHSFLYSFIHSFIHLFLYSLIDGLIDWFVGSFDDLWIDALTS